VGSVDSISGRPCNRNPLLARENFVHAAGSGFCHRLGVFVVEFGAGLNGENGQNRRNSSLGFGGCRWIGYDLRPRRARVG